MTEILVIGGAGYVGSHMVKLLRQCGYAVVVLDDLSGGFSNAVLDAKLVVGSIADTSLLDQVFASHHFAAVMHFASFIQVAESVTAPDRYYANNVAATLTLLAAMLKWGVAKFIFSSTAAVYGNPQSVLIDEDHPKNPINPYGRSKLMVEQVLEDYDRAYGIKAVCLRYFNAAGADQNGQLGERHEPETHLIPLVLQAASGRREFISVYGSDYDTPDGTCIRDYVHVADLCDAHLLALLRLLEGGTSGRFNLGNGMGYSVKEVIETAHVISKRDIKVHYQARRAGDPPRLVANSSLARAELGWQPQRGELATIMKDAWAWEQKYPWLNV